MPTDSGSYLLTRSVALAYAGTMLALIVSGYISLTYAPLMIVSPLLVNSMYVVYLTTSKVGISRFYLLPVSLLCVSSIVSTIRNSSDWAYSFAFAAFEIGPLLLLVWKPSYTDARLIRFVSPLLALLASAWVILFSTRLGISELGPWSTSGPYGGSTEYAAIINMTWPILLGLSLDASRIYKRIIYAILTVACVISVFVLYSRSGLLISIAMFLLFILASLRRTIHKSTYVFLAVLSVLALLMLNSGNGIKPNYNETVNQFLVRYRLVNFQPQYPRSIIWQAAIDILEGDKLFFGIGPGNTKIALSALNMYHAHNNILEFTLQFGIIGGSALLLIQGYVSLRALRGLLRSSAPGKSPQLVLGLSVSLISYLVVSSVSSPATSPEIVLFFPLCVRALDYYLSTPSRVGDLSKTGIGRPTTWSGAKSARRRPEP